MAAVDSEVAATQAPDSTVDSETAAVIGPDARTAAPLDKMTTIDLKTASVSHCQPVTQKRRLLARMQ